MIWSVIYVELRFALSADGASAHGVADFADIDKTKPHSYISQRL
jgi:hypothetical protein